VTISVGEPLTINPGESAHISTQRLKERLTELQRQVQADYPDHGTPGEAPFWLPARLGGSAPTPEQAAALDRAERDKR